MPLIHLVLAALLAAAALPARFGRPALCPAEPSGYKLETLDDIEFPTLEKERAAVSCLLYRDAAAIYAEVVVSNRSKSTLALAAEPIEVEQGGRRLARLHTGKTAEEIERGALRPFTPSRSGGRYAPDSVQHQASEHIETQEREAMFAAFLITNALEETRLTVPSGEHQAFAAAFSRPQKEKSAELRVVVRAGGDQFTFVFKPCASAAPPSPR